MDPKFKTGERVRVREEFVHVVASYVYRVVNRRRIVGVVKRHCADGSVHVDFAQRDVAKQNGRYIGEKARVGAAYRRLKGYVGKHFPAEMLECA